LPAECDFMMREKNWFYSDSDEYSVKSVDELVGLYYHSVGRGANFLVNIGPDRRGLLPDKDAGRLIEFGNEIKRRFANPIKSQFKRTDNGGIIGLDEPQLINHVILGEDLSEGESVREFKIYVKARKIRNNLCIYEGKTIGRKHIVLFPAIKVSEVTVEITKSDGEFRLTEPQTFYVK